MDFLTNMSSKNTTVSKGTTDTEVPTSYLPMYTNQRKESSTEATEMIVNFKFVDVVTPQTPTSGNYVVHEDVVPDSNSPMDTNQTQKSSTEDT